MSFSFWLELRIHDVAKGACIGSMENGIAPESRCVIGSILLHFLPVAYWLGCIIIHFIHLLHCPSPVSCAVLELECGCNMFL